MWQPPTQTILADLQNKPAGTWLLTQVRGMIEYHKNELESLRALEKKLSTKGRKPPPRPGRRAASPPPKKMPITTTEQKQKQPPLQSPKKKKAPPPVPITTTKGKKVPPPLPHVGDNGVQSRFPEPPNSPTPQTTTGGDNRVAVNSSTPRAKILFDFESSDAHCLNVKKDTIVSIIRKDASGWWKIESNGKRGYIPRDYAKPIGGGEHGPPLPRAKTAPQEQPLKSPVEKIKKMYGSPTGVDMSALAKGAVLRRRQSAEDREAADANRRKQPTEEVASPANTFVFAVAEYDYDSNDSDDLPFQEGDLIRILSYDDNNSGWMTGETRTKRAAFPSNYVKILKKDAGKTVAVTNTQIKSGQLTLEEGEFVYLITQGDRTMIIEKNGVRTEVPASKMAICK